MPEILGVPIEVSLILIVAIGLVSAEEGHASVQCGSHGAVVCIGIGITTEPMIVHSSAGCTGCCLLVVGTYGMFGMSQRMAPPGLDAKQVSVGNGVGRC